MTTRLFFLKKVLSISTLLKLFCNSSCMICQKKKKHPQLKFKKSFLHSILRKNTFQNTQDVRNSIVNQHQE